MEKTYFRELEFTFHDFIFIVIEFWYNEKWKDQKSELKT